MTNENTERKKEARGSSWSEVVSYVRGVAHARGFAFGRVPNPEAVMAFLLHAEDKRAELSRKLEVERARSRKLAQELAELRSNPAGGWNSADMLPPVGCPLELNLGARYGYDTAYGERLAHIEQKDRAMTYKLSTGEVITGRFPWTYP